jgi:hypothetical protein
VSQRNDDGARPTKAVRKEEARRQRLELERKAARARRNRAIWIGVAIVSVVAVLVVVLTRPEEQSQAAGRAADLLAASAAETAAAGCAEVADVGAYQPEDLDQAHVGAEDGPDTMPAFSTYASQPPASGPHATGTLPAGVYSSPPPMDTLIHSLEHGAAIVWYSPDASGPELAEIQEFFRDADVGSRVIVAPYDYPDEGDGGSLPAGSEMALVSWHHTQTCAEANLAAAFGFTARYAFPTFEGEDYLGNAPEPGAAL